jgi:hypothetical protein
VRTTIPIEAPTLRQVSVLEPKCESNHEGQGTCQSAKCPREGTCDIVA